MSSAAEGLCSWVLAIKVYGRVAEAEVGSIKLFQVSFIPPQVDISLGVTSKLNRRLIAQNRRSRAVAIVQNNTTAQNRRLRAVNRQLSFEVIPYLKVLG